MSRKLTVEQITTLLYSLPTTKFGKIDWKSSPKLVARIAKALIQAKEGMVTLTSTVAGVHNQILYAIMRGKTPDGGKEWPELREALSKMKCDWRGKEKETSSVSTELVGTYVVGRTSTSLMPVTSESLDQVFGEPEVTTTKVVKPSKKRVKVKGEQVSKQEQKFYDFETKELVVVTTTRYVIDGDSLTHLLNS